MRLLTITTLLSATLALASPQDGYVTSVSTFTLYRTVERVVETTYATLPSPTSSAISDTELPHEPTLSPSPVASASMGTMPSYNGTASGAGSTGAVGTGTAPDMSASIVPQASGNVGATTRTMGGLVAVAAGMAGAVLL